MERLKEIEDRLNKVTQGEWISTEMTSHKSRKNNSKYFKVVQKEYALSQLAHYIPTKGDAEFIAHAPEDIKYLLDKVAELEAVNKQAEEYEKAEADGLLVRLPCKVGDALYFIDKLQGDIYKKAEMDGMGVHWTNETDIGDFIPLSVIGKTVFPSMEEAERALYGPCHGCIHWDDRFDNPCVMDCTNYDKYEAEEVLRGKV